MSLNLKYFSGFTLIFSAIFFYALYSNLISESYDSIWIYALLYGTALFISGLALGYKDSVRKSRLDLGFQYHLMTFVIVNSVGIISLLIAMGFSTQNLMTGILSMLFWTLGILVHYYYSSKTLKGIDKEAIFD
jgi:hypothetical protein